MGFAVDALVAELWAAIIPSLRRSRRIGRRYLANSPQSAEALAQLAALPAGAPDALREYLRGDYQIHTADPQSTADGFALGSCRCL